VDGFALTEPELRERRGAKWHHFPEDVLPAWVADMDFPVPEPVQAAIKAVVDRGDYGYPRRDGRDRIQEAFSERMAERFGWEPDPDCVLPVADLVQAMTACLVAFSDEGEGVVVQTPVYPPFLATIDQTRRRRDSAPLLDTGERFVSDQRSLTACLHNDTRVVMLCNPHNPTGRVFEREELAAIGHLAVERDLVIVSDEIHCDLVYAGATYLPMAKLSHEIAARTVTLNSATKGFNIPGLRCGVMHFGSRGLLERFRARVPDRLLGGFNVVGHDATVAAWREGQPWLDQVLKLLLDNRDRVARWVEERAPAIRHHKPEATYLAWLDCAGLDLPMPPQEWFLERAKVGMNAGRDFGPEGESCVRLNFATSPEILEKILARLSAALP
jgi:cystathionine beta-lyase